MASNALKRAAKRMEILAWLFFLFFVVLLPFSAYILPGMIAERTARGEKVDLWFVQLASDAAENMHRTHGALVLLMLALALWISFTARSKR